MTKYPLVSIVTACKNHCSFLAECIESVSGQGYPNCEHIIVDGLSTDGTRDYLKGLENDNIVWISEADEGQSDALNKGFRLAKGKYICWLNADDILMPDVVRLAVDFFESRPDCDVLYGNWEIIDKKGNLLRSTRTLPMFKWLLKYRGCYIPSSGCFFKNQSVFKSGNFLDMNLHYLMDYDLFLKLSYLCKKFYHINYFTSKFRVYPEAKTSNLERRWIERRRILKSYKILFSGESFLNRVCFKIRNYLVAVIFHFLLVAYKLLRR